MIYFDNSKFFGYKIIKVQKINHQQSFLGATKSKKKCFLYEKAAQLDQKTFNVTLFFHFSPKLFGNLKINTYLCRTKKLISVVEVFEFSEIRCYWSSSN